MATATATRLLELALDYTLRAYRIILVQTVVETAFDQARENAELQAAAAGIADLDEYWEVDHLVHLYMSTIHLGLKNLSIALMDTIVLYACKQVGVSDRTAFNRYMWLLFWDYCDDSDLWGRVHQSFGRAVRTKLPYSAFKSKAARRHKAAVTARQPEDKDTREPEGVDADLDEVSNEYKLA